jgi:hypothetical protein
MAMDDVTRIMAQSTKSTVANDPVLCLRVIYERNVSWSATTT